MSAAYDSYDYPSYWIGRDYEHHSEINAIKSFLFKIKKLGTILEVGSGFGRLVPSYSYRAKKVILTDPSSKLLKISRDVYKNSKKIKFVHSSLENLYKKIKPRSVDLIIMVRVIHHIKDVPNAVRIVNKLLKPDGYFILEFANKTNLKSISKNFMKGNFTFVHDIFTTDIRSKKSLNQNTLPFLNFHPHYIRELLQTNNFEIINIKSVSNSRSGFLKKVFSTDVLLYIEKLIQDILAHIYFGPSIFILARKKG